MRPGAWSEKGFLGGSERLEDVLEGDRQTLSELGLEPEDLAEALDCLVGAAGAHFIESEDSDPASVEFASRMREAVAKAEARFGSVEQLSESWGVLVGERFEVSERHYFGSQECPWGPGWRDAEPGQAIRLCGWGSSDWFITDVRRELSMSGPSLITHLIREHGFFEGIKSPYRVDPRALAELLQIGPYADPA